MLQNFPQQTVYWCINCKNLGLRQGGDLYFCPTCCHVFSLGAITIGDRHEQQLSSRLGGEASYPD